MGTTQAPGDRAVLDVSPRTFAAAWENPAVQASLTAIGSALVDVAGWDAVAVNGVYGPDELRIVSTAGEAALVTDLRSQSFPLRVVLAAAEAAAIGDVAFLPSGALPLEVVAHDFGPGPGAQHPGRWQHDDAVLAVLRHPGYPPREQAPVIGLLSLDLPRDGMRPDDGRLDQVRALARIAERALAEALDRQLWFEAGQAAEVVRDVQAAAAAEHTPYDVLHAALAALAPLGLTEAMGVLAQDPDHVVGTGPGRAWPAREVLSVAGRCLDHQRVLVVAVDQPSAAELGPAQHTALARDLAARGLHSTVLVPLGAAGELLGVLALGRGAGQPAWSETEQTALLEVGAGVGTSLVSARLVQREHDLVDRLRALQTYKQTLVSSFSHELRTPLTSLRSHAELLAGELDGVPGARRPLVAVRRQVERLERLVADLVLLSRAVDDEPPTDLHPTDLRGLVRDAAEVDAERRSEVVHEVVLPREPLGVRADPAELGPALVSLVSAALPDDGLVRLVGEICEGEVLLTVSGSLTTAPGVADGDDLAGEFIDFFRAHDPMVRRLPGSGLGLRVAGAVATRYGGRLDVRRLGAGRAELTLRLPAVPLDPPSR
ncbi:MAG: hypothetical protein CMH83_09550 [Nocardioides sp.]|nr:hypothetical protein [Nocardioides sp.]